MPFEKKTRHQYAGADKADQRTYLSAGLRNSQNAFCHLLFCFCVTEYKQHPTKTKAIFIWDRFLKNVGSFNFGSDDPSVLSLDVDECGDAGVLPQIRWWMDELMKMREQALGMGRLRRAFTSADRAPPPHLFDAFVNAMLARPGDSVWNEIEMILHLDRLRSSDTYKSLIKLMPRLRKDLETAGFRTTAAAVPLA